MDINQFDRLRLAPRTDTKAGRRATALRLQEAAKALLRALPAYPEPEHKANDVMRDRAAVGNQLAYLIDGVAGAPLGPGETPETRRALLLGFLAAVEAEIAVRFADPALPPFDAASLDDEIADSEERVSQTRAHIRRCRLTLDDLEARLNRTIAVKTTFREVVRVERRRAAR